MQLLLFGLLSVSSARRLVPRDGSAGRALGALGLLGLALFCDEVGSIHERANRLFPLPGDLALLPLALVGGAVLTYSVFILHRRKEMLGNAVGYVIVGFALFVFVYIQEYAEHRLAWPSWMRGLRGALEEGTELTGFFVLLRMSVALRRRIGIPRRQRLLPDPQTLSMFAKVMLLLALPLVLFRGQFTPQALHLPLRGDFGNLIPIAAFAGGALVTARCALLDAEHRTRWWIVSGVLLLLSTDAAAHYHHYLWRDSDVRWRSELGLLWGVPLLGASTCTIRHFRTLRRLMLAILVFLGVVVAAVMAVPMLSLAVVYASALLVLALLLRVSDEMSMATSPREMAGDENEAAHRSRNGPGTQLHRYERADDREGVGREEPGSCEGSRQVRNCP